MGSWAQQGKERVKSIERAALIHIHTFPSCEAGSWWEAVVYNTGSSAWGSVVTSSGGMGRWEGASRGRR